MTTAEPKLPPLPKAKKLSPKSTDKEADLATAVADVAVSVSMAPVVSSSVVALQENYLRQTLASLQPPEEGAPSSSNVAERIDVYQGLGTFCLKLSPM